MLAEHLREKNNTLRIIKRERGGREEISFIKERGKKRKGGKKRLYKTQEEGRSAFLHM